MTHDGYLLNEILRYFPKASKIFVSQDMDKETITITIQNRYGQPCDDLILFMQIGSDDDWFEFSKIDDANDYIITIPLYPSTLME